MRRAWLFVVVFGVACGGAAPITRTPPDAPTREEYADSLKDFGLSQSALGRDWVAAGDRALESPTVASVPFSESGYFPPATPSAVGYRLTLRRGRTLVVEVTFEASQPTQLFLDLFEDPEPGADDAPRRVAEADPGSRRLEFEIRRDGDYIVRLQPELLRGGRYTIVERTRNTLAFPVQGQSLRASQSGFGAPRDAGRRSHQGIDLFAPRGTPVVAAAPGTVRVDTNTLGGNVIWLRDATASTRRSLYYAHLDGWAVDDGARVTTGQVIGYVGNTGNARTTPPHLHFGVYERGATDPFPYLLPADGAPPAIAGATSLIGDWARVRRAKAPLRPLPTSRAAVIAPLDVNTPVTIVAATAAYYRVVVPDGRTGYLATSDVISAATPLRQDRIASAAALREFPSATAPRIETLSPHTPVERLGTFGDFSLVRTAGLIGWLDVRAVIDLH